LWWLSFKVAIGKAAGTNMLAYSSTTVLLRRLRRTGHVLDSFEACGCFDRILDDGAYDGTPAHPNWKDSGIVLLSMRQ